MGSKPEMASQEEEEEEAEATLDGLPSALVATVMTKLDVASICSLASTSSVFRSCARHILSFLPSFQLLDIAPSVEILIPLLPPNPHLKTLKLDCARLDDYAIVFLLKPSLHDLSLHNCADFSGRLLSQIGTRCTDLRSLYLGSVAENRDRSIHISDLEDLLTGCSNLESLILMFDVSLFLRPNFARTWASASEKLTSLEIGYISSVMVTELLTPNLGSHLPSNPVQPSILPSIEKLCLNVDYITDAMVGTISKGLVSLTHLDLQDAPMIEPGVTFDLTNAGLQQINHLGRLKHLSLVRSQEYLITYFRRVNDLGLLIMADKCANMESICLGGFCRVTDTGFKTVLHSCTRLYKLKVTHGTHLTDLVFHDISATSLTLTHVSLRRCNLLTNHAVLSLASNKELKVLDLRDCRSLGDEALQAIGTLPRLKILLLDGSDITDAGLLYLRPSVISSLYALSLRGCKRLTDKCIMALFNGCCVLELRELDLSNLPNLSDNGVLLLAKSRIPFFELRMRQCPLIGDISVMALASMLVDEAARHGSSLRLLDLYNCGRITPLAFRWLKKPYFPRLKWLGVTGIVNRDIVDALARSRPFLHVACHGEELGADPYDTSDGLYTHDYDDVDEFEKWLLEAEIDSDYEEMGDGENNNEMVV
ncbi:F-box/LRR-repeat protein 10, partial [Mucuna pruriens]